MCIIGILQDLLENWILNYLEIYLMKILMLARMFQFYKAFNTTPNEYDKKFHHPY